MNKLSRCGPVACNDNLAIHCAVSGSNDRTPDRWMDGWMAVRPKSNAHFPLPASLPPFLPQLISCTFWQRSEVISRIYLGSAFWQILKGPHTVFTFKNSTFSSVKNADGYVHLGWLQVIVPPLKKAAAGGGIAMVFPLLHLGTSQH